MSKNDGGPAFPVGSGDMRDPIGMSLRDYFASDAMKAALTAAASWSAVDFDKDIDVEALAIFAHKMADAMLAERAK